MAQVLLEIAMCVDDMNPAVLLLLERPLFLSRTEAERLIEAAVGHADFEMFSGWRRDDQSIWNFSAERAVYSLISYPITFPHNLRSPEQGDTENIRAMRKFALAADPVIRSAWLSQRAVVCVEGMRKREEFGPQLRAEILPIAGRLVDDRCLLFWLQGVHQGLALPTPENVALLREGRWPTSR